MSVERIVAEAALEVPVAFLKDPWPGQTIERPANIPDDQMAMELDPKVPPADQDMRRLEPSGRWLFLKRQVLIDHGITSYTWGDMRSPLPLGLQYAYDLVERNTDYWWPQKGPARRFITWDAYLSTVRDVARILARETPALLIMELKGASDVDLAASAVAAATERAKLGVAHSVLTASDEEELVLRKPPKTDTNVSFGVMTNEARKRVVREYVLFYLQGKKTFTFKELNERRMPTAYEVAYFICERVIVLHPKYLGTTWDDLMRAMQRIRNIFTSEEMQSPSPELAHEMGKLALRDAQYTLLGMSGGQARIDKIVPRSRDVDALMAKMLLLKKDIEPEEQARVSEELHMQDADKKQQEAMESQARGDPEEVWERLTIHSQFLKFFGTNVLAYLVDLGASDGLLAALTLVAERTSNIFVESLAAKGLDDNLLASSIRLAANRVALNHEFAQRMVSDNLVLDFQKQMGVEITRIVTTDESMGKQAHERLLSWATNTILPTWVAASDAAGARKDLHASYKSVGADEHTLSNLTAALKEEWSLKAPYQVFSSQGPYGYVLQPVNAEKRMWLCRNTVIQGYVAEYNDGYLGFGSLFTEDVEDRYGGSSKGRPSFESRSGVGIHEHEFKVRTNKQDIVCIHDNRIIMQLMWPVMGGSEEALKGLWFHSLLKEPEALMLVLSGKQENVEALLTRRIKNDLFVPIAAVFPTIQTVIYSGGDASAMNSGSRYGGISPHRDMPDLRVHVDKIDFYSGNKHTDAFVIWQRMEFLEFSLLTTVGAVQDKYADLGYRLPVVFADCVKGAYSHFTPSRQVDEQVGPAQVSRSLVSLYKPDPEGYTQILPSFKKAVMDGAIACELHVDLFTDEVTGSKHELFCTVRWLDSPPTLSGSEYALSVFPDDVRWVWEGEDDAYGLVVTTDEQKMLREVTWVPGFNPIYVVKAGLDPSLVEFINKTVKRDTFVDSTIMHNTNFIPGKHPSDKSKCDPRVRLAMAKWDKDHDERKGIEWWRHMERERLKQNCPRSVWMKAWGAYILEEAEERKRLAKKEGEKRTRAQKEEDAKKALREQQKEQEREAEKERKRILVAQREDEEWQEKARSQGDLRIEMMLKKEAEEEALLWKRAALQLAEELNKKWDQAIQEQVKAKKNQVAQDRATERSKAGQDAANARRAARDEKLRKDREEKERKAEEAAARKAAFQAEKAERAKGKSQGAAAGAYQDQPKGNKGNKNRR